MNVGPNETALSLSGSLFLSHNHGAGEEPSVNVTDIKHDLSRENG
jgi:hypothetical protein